MGLIKDAIGSALGAGQVNNGFNGPKLPFSNNNNTRARQQVRPSYLNPNSASQSHSSSQSLSRLEPTPDDDPPDYDYATRNSRPPQRNEKSPYRAQRRDPSPYAYGRDDRSWSPEFDGGPQQRTYRDTSSYQQTWRQDSSILDFRPFALPQVTYGDGQPFMRAYSHELGQYGISEKDFIEILDAVNVAIIPNPENQIFQKAAGIAGWFVPGAAGIGLMAGQIGVGVGAAFGHMSMIARVLSRANLDLFIPNGLEICIAKTKDVDNEVGASSGYGNYSGYGASSGLGFSSRYGNPSGYGNSSNYGGSSFGASPEQRIAAYGDMLAPVTRRLPPLQNTGRSDPIAMLGRGMANRDNQKKLSKAQEEIAKGKSKDANSIEGGLKWLMVRRASPKATEKWQQTLRESEAALRQEQEQGRRI